MIQNPGFDLNFQHLSQNQVNVVAFCFLYCILILSFMNIHAKLHPLTMNNYIKKTFMFVHITMKLLVRSTNAGLYLI